MTAIPTHPGAWTLRFQGVGNSFAAAELGSAMATLERDGVPLLAIDCGAEGLRAYVARYGEIPRAVFVTHTHFDHVGGFEQFFGASYFATPPSARPRVYAPAAIVPLLHQRVGSYPNVLAEGGANFWDAFQLIPVGDHFWHAGLRFGVFPVRHHWPQTAFGLRLPGSLVWSGDTRPIAEVLAAHADAGEVIAHDCALHGNPSHSGIEDLEREYPPELLARCVLYHYGSLAEAGMLAARGHRVARAGEVLSLSPPRVVPLPHT